jgi:hypothetical protein
MPETNGHSRLTRSISTFRKPPPELPTPVFQPLPGVDRLLRISPPKQVDEFAVRAFVEYLNAKTTSSSSTSSSSTSSSSASSSSASSSSASSSPSPETSMGMSGSEPPLGKRRG